MLQTLLTIFPLFLIIFGATLVQKWKKLDSGWENILNKFALNVGFPALIFSALSKIELHLGDYSSLLVMNSGLLLGSFLIAFLIAKLLKLNKSLSRTLIFCLPFANTAYLGIPVVVQIYGEAALPTATLVTAIYLFWVFTLGIGILEHTQAHHEERAFKRTLMGLLKNPLLIAVVFGLLGAGLKVQFPVFITKTLDMLAASVTPLVLIVIGLFIGQSKIGKIREWLPVLGVALCILGLFPGLLYLATFKLNLDSNFFFVSVIQAATPMAITPFALAHHYQMDKSFIARCIVLSTVLSVFTIPLWSLVL